MRVLTLSLLIMVLVATLGLGWLFDNFFQQYQQQNHQNQPLNRATDEVSVLEDVGQSIATALNGLTNKQQFINQWSTQNDRHLNLLELTDFPLPQPLMNELISGKPLVLETADSFAIHYFLGSSQQVLMLTSPRVNEQSQYSLLAVILTSTFYVVMIALMLLWLYPLLKRLVNLRSVAKAFGEGKLEQRIDVGSVSYIRDVEIEFNHMAQRIEGLVSDVKLLSNAVSHDLRTPLARIRFGIDTLQEEDDLELRKCFQDKISDNVDEMSRLVETLLNYARLDQAMINVDKSRINFSALLTRSITHKQDDTTALSLNMPTDPLYMVGDSNYLMILIANLLQNAHQYCQQAIQVNLFEEGDFIVLTIEDDGSGILPDFRNKIIQPFIRGDNITQDLQSPKKKKVKGYGMGLAIVKRIVDWHHGQLDISDSVILSGAKFTVKLLKC